MPFSQPFHAKNWHVLANFQLGPKGSAKAGPIGRVRRARRAAGSDVRHGSLSK